MKLQQSYLKKIVVGALLLLAIFVFASCYAPSPLYGKWADNQGSSITFVSDGTFTASITNSSGVKTQDTGSYTVIENVIVFSKSSGASISTEWDIRGSILYLIWTNDSGVSQNLSLYRISN